MKIYKLISWTIIFFFTIIIFIQCSDKKQSTTTPKIITGWLTESYLFKELPQYNDEKDAYHPDKNVIEQLNSINKNFNVLVFMGTYCPDCKREVPRFLKIVNQLENVNLGYKLFGLDRADVDTSGMREKYNIEYIPTFIIYYNGEEIGRIIESPMVTMENDLLEICSTF